MKADPSAFRSRRRFLGETGCAALSSLPMLNTLLNLQLSGSIAQASTPGASEYRAIVCLFLTGGMDSFNMLTPRDNTGYAEYFAERGSTISLPQASLLPITPLSTDAQGRSFGLHPGMPEIQTLFQAGHAAFVANVGTLVQPTTLTTYNNGAATLPVGLFSHSDQEEQWQSSTPDHRSGIGWAGRMADLIHSINTNNVVSMNVSLDGANVWQTGNNVFEYAITQDGATALNNYTEKWQTESGTVQRRSAGVDGLLALQYQNLLQSSYAQSERSALDAFDQFSQATSPALPNGATFPSTTLAQQLEMVVKTINGRSALGMTRQTFFLQNPGWDHHDDVIGNMSAMVPVISQAISAFYNALTLIGMQNQVTLFLVSDFGRTLTSNGKGTDHAWGGNMLVVGGSVAGQRIYGQYPSLYNNNPLDVGRGRLIPTTSVDQYFAELALWLGVSPASLPLVLPNISRFYDINSGVSPVGFLP